MLVPNGLCLGRLAGDNPRGREIVDGVIRIVDVHEELALLRAHDGRIPWLRARLQPGQKTRADRQKGHAYSAEHHRLAAAGQRIVDHAGIAQYEPVFHTPA